MIALRYRKFLNVQKVYIHLWYVSHVIVKQRPESSLESSKVCSKCSALLVLLFDVLTIIVRC